MSNEKNGFISFEKTEVEKWSPEEVVLVVAGTGRGKSSMVEKLAQMYAGSKILELSPREFLKSQQENNLQESEVEEAKNIDCMTYQRVQSMKAEEIKTLNDTYDFLVLDEIHALITDSHFNRTTTSLLTRILREFKGIIVGMTATDCGIEELIWRIAKRRCRTYRYEKNFDFISGPIQLFPDTATIAQVIRETVAKGEKVLVFGENIQTLEALQKELVLDANTLMVVSEHSPKYKKLCEKNADKIEEMKLKERLPMNIQVLLTTTVLEMGVNLKDPLITCVVSFSVNLCSIEQMIGRKRRAKGEGVRVYVKSYSSDELKKIREEEQKALKVYKQYMNHREQFNEKYEYDLNDVYGVIRTRTCGNNAELYVDECRVLRAEFLLKTTCKGNTYDFERALQDWFGKETFRLPKAKVVDTLEQFDDKILKNKEEKSVFVNLLELGRTAKGLNALFEAENIPYRIIELKCVTDVDEHGNKKQYRHAWKIVKIQQ
ncbi:MAG: AAA family ATPase [Clostridia bacterium]|nr:AAA family ATPase [Clostridia bacterium]